MLVVVLPVSGPLPVQGDEMYFTKTTGWIFPVVSRDSVLLLLAFLPILLEYTLLFHLLLLGFTQFVCKFTNCSGNMLEIILSWRIVVSDLTVSPITSFRSLPSQIRSDTNLSLRYDDVLSLEALYHQLELLLMSYYQRFWLL